MQQGLPPLTVEDPPSLGEPDYPFLGNQSLVSNTKSINTSQDSILPKHFFIEGFVPPYNPAIIYPLGQLLIQVAHVPTISSNISTPTIPSKTNGLWDFMDNFGPPSLPQSIVNTTPLIVNPAIQTMPSPSNLVTPNMRET